MRITDQIEDLRLALPKMPKHTEVNAIIPSSYRQFPKNLMDFSAEKMEDFVNPNLAIIEEIGYRNPKSIIPKWFLQYHKKYYSKYNILKGDSYFQSKMRDGFRKHLSPNFSEIREIGVYGNTRGYFNSMAAPHVNGATLETETATGTDNNWSGNIMASRLATGTVGEYYDQIALSLAAVGTNNNRFGCYDDTGSTTPNNLLAETGSVAAVADYAWHSVTEFALTTTQEWTAYQYDSNTGLSINAKTGLTGQNKGWYKSQAYGAFGSFSSPLDMGRIWQSKIGHS